MRDTIWTYFGSVAERPAAAAAAGSVRWRKGFSGGDEKGRSGCCGELCGCCVLWSSCCSCEGDGTLVSTLEEAVDDVGVFGSFGLVKGCCDLGIWAFCCAASCAVRVVE